jgi:hypothetical protein
MDGTGIKIIRLPYYGTNKCERTELFLKINRTSQFVIIKEGHVVISGDRNVIKKKTGKI